MCRLAFIFHFSGYSGNASEKLSIFRGLHHRNILYIIEVYFIENTRNCAVCVGRATFLKRDSAKCTGNTRCIGCITGVCSAYSLHEGVPQNHTCTSRVFFSGDLWCSARVSVSDVLSPCRSSPCQHAGTCTYEACEMTCACVSYRTGQLCDGRHITCKVW